jgi:hypothetical protein
MNPARVTYTTAVKHENTLHDLVVENMPAIQCSNCNGLLVNEQSEVAIYDTLRVVLLATRAGVVGNCAPTSQYVLTQP